MAKRDNLELLFDEIHSIPVKYSKISKRIDSVFSFFTIEKIKELNNKRYKCNSLDFCDKIQENQNEGINSDQYMQIINPSIIGSKLPTIRLLRPDTMHKSVFLTADTSVKNINNVSNSKSKNDQLKEEREQKLYLRHCNEQKIKRKMNLIKPDCWRYTPNYKSIEKQIPCAFIKKERKKSTQQKTTERLSIFNDSFKSEVNWKKMFKTSTMMNYNRDTNTRTTSVLSKPYKSLRESKKKSNDSFFSNKNDSNTNKSMTHGVSFKTMTERDNKWLNGNTPCSGAYTPKYTGIDKNKTAFSFDGEISLSASKKYIIRKIIHSYDVKNDFVTFNLVNNPKTAIKEYKNSFHRKIMHKIK